MASISKKGNTQFVTEALEEMMRMRDETQKAYLSNPLNIMFKQMHMMYVNTIKLLEEAVKFRVPMNGNILQDMIDGKSIGEAVQDYLTEYKLPFPTITIECENDVTADHEDFVENNLEYKGTIIVAWEDNAEEVNPVVKMIVLNKCREARNMPYRWMVLPYFIKIDFKQATPNCDWTQFVKPVPFFPSVPLTEFFNDTRSEMSTLTQFLIALSCKNVSLKKGFPPSLTDNKKREKKGKPKLNQYYEILIESKFGQTKEINDINKTKHGSTGGTKAPHIRRGHIRHYEGKNVWIEATVVNAHKGAAVTKTYKVK